MTADDAIVERLCGDDDLTGILDVESESFTNPWTREMYEWELTNRDICSILVVRTPDCRVAGFCAFWLVFDEIHINNVAIRPAYRGRGYGTLLMRQVLAEGRVLGATRATLEVRVSNTGARRLYERLGFAVAGTRKKYYTSPDEDGLILWHEHV